MIHLCNLACFYISYSNIKYPICLLQAKSEDEVQTEKAWMEAEQVWLIHKGGFASAHLLKSNEALPEGKIKIKLESQGDILEVDEDDIEKVMSVWVSGERCS